MPHPDIGIGVECAEHGKTNGWRDSDGILRCTCGRFAERAPEYCAEHHVDYEALPHDSCPRCQQEADLEAREQERMARRSDPNMHNMVDAPANAIDHSRSPSDFR